MTSETMLRSTANRLAADTVQIGTATGGQAMPIAAMVGFFFAFRLFIVLLMVHLLMVDGQTAAASGLVLNYLLFLVVAFCSFGPATTPLRTMFQSRSFRWVVIFLTFSGFSLFWTAAASIYAAAAFWVAMFADTAMVVLLLRCNPERSVAGSLMKGYVSGTVVIAAIAWIMPAQQDLRLGDDQLLGPNQIGFACAFAVFLAQYLIASGERQWRWPAIFLAVTLLRSLSKTTIIAFVMSQVLLLIRDRSTSRAMKVAFGLGSGLVIVAFWGLIEAYYDVYSNAGNQAETLTGRIGIWAVVLGKALEQPWIGHGFHSVWKVLPPFGDFEARHAHNELFQQFYAYGAAGVIMLCGLYGSFFRQMRKIPQSPLKTLSFGLLLFVIVRGFADTEAFDLSLPLWMIALLGITAARSGRCIEVAP